MKITAERMAMAKALRRLGRNLATGGALCAVEARGWWVAKELLARTLCRVLPNETFDLEVDVQAGSEPGTETIRIVRGTIRRFEDN